MQCITLEDSSLGSFQNDDQSIVENMAQQRDVNPSPLPPAEPIYAVINLKKKYQGRAKLNKHSSSSSSSLMMEQQSHLVVLPDQENKTNRERTASIASSTVSSVNSAASADSPPLEKPPSPGYAYIREFSDYNNNNKSSQKNEELAEGNYAKIRSLGLGEEQQQQRRRPNSFHSSGDYEEVKLENQLFMRDYHLCLSRNE